MPTENSRTNTLKAIEEITHFFANLTDKEKTILPSVLKMNGSWFSIYDDYSLGIFYITEKENDRVNKYLEKGFPAFPGFIISENKKSTDIPIAIVEKGKCNYFSSNHTSNLIAFKIFPESSFTVVNHIHEINDASGQKFKYHVDLAFFLGTLPNEDWDKLKIRLLELLQYSLNVWKTIQ